MTKLYMCFRLAPKLMTLDDLGLLSNFLGILRNFARFGLNG